MVVLGSREQYCVNPKVSKVQSGSKNLACKRLLQEQSGCQFKHGKSRVYAHESIQNRVWDIEELVQVGQQVKGCPYFASRAMLAYSELIFCPYNYILEPNIRKSIGINLKNAVVIFDEAHNIESICADVASFECNLEVLETAVEELPLVLTDGSHDADALMACVSKLFESLSLWAEQEVAMDKPLIWQGPKILALLDQCKINAETLPRMAGAFYEALADKDENGNDDTVGLVADHRKRQKSNNKVMSAVVEQTLRNLLQTLEFMLMDNFKFLQDYRCVVSKAEERGQGGVKRLVTRLHFWSMSSAVAFQKLKEETRCVILASGTLSPMDSFASELQVAFPLRLEANHVIDTSKQLWTAVLPFYENNIVFNWTYRSSENVLLQDALGHSLMGICQVVQGGVLVFFSSYSVLNKLVKRWKSTGFWDTLLATKCILIEPQGPIDYAISCFYKANGDSSKRSPSSVRKKKSLAFGESEPKFLPSQTGGIFLAVCRGKISEGIDFSNQHCRAVCLIGIPFPNTQDLQLKLRREDHEVKSRTSDVISGSAWYSLQAFRALNQAIGRSIRHQNDFGAIILLDERYADPKMQQSVSKWIRPTIRVHNAIMPALESLRDFFAANNYQAAKPAATLTEQPRWCCCKCARPISLGASPEEHMNATMMMRNLAGNVNTSQVAVYSFPLSSLNPQCVGRREGLVWEPADIQAYSVLQCGCGEAFGAEVASSGVVLNIGVVWALKAAFLDV